MKGYRLFVNTTKKEGADKMSEFDKIIGYEAIKNELRQVCDMMKNKEVYTKLGATQPRGILLHGNPGMGKIPYV